MKNVLAIAATLILASSALADSIPTIMLNPAVNQFANLIPGDIDQLIAEWTVTAPDAESILVTSLQVSLVGAIGIENLFLWDDSTLVAFPIVAPTANDTLTFISGLTIGASTTAFLMLEADVFSDANGTTIQASIPEEGLGAIGLTSSIYYTEPSALLVGGIHEVGPSPEPSTLVLLVVGMTVIGIGTLKRRRQFFN